MEITALFIMQYLHILGMIIGMGAALVIEIFGFISRKSDFWTGVTIDTHYVTKPLIWIGTILFAVTWIFIAGNNLFSAPHLYKTILIFILFVNGSYLSFFISPRLIIHKKENPKMRVLPNWLQLAIIPSALISSGGWLITLFLTIYLWP